MIPRRYLRGRPASITPVSRLCFDLPAHRGLALSNGARTDRGIHPPGSTVDGVIARIVPSAYAGGLELDVDGTPQSHVDLDDPTHLHFEYIARMGAVDGPAPAAAPAADRRAPRRRGAHASPLHRGDQARLAPAGRRARARTVGPRAREHALAAQRRDPRADRRRPGGAGTPPRGARGQRRPARVGRVLRRRRRLHTSRPSSSTARRRRCSRPRACCS